ncbi:cation-independent mannose-6-phosphate receptor-like isoform X1 [Ceratitis capitata]|uniref:cation-independent mannose-6-phosphate receptor-like isoform X1 n=1 Tax=Ceratitis capitata TaxID=7213 RepID=UPI000618822E|nr:cation-independent mannose-6-phosphate receptor-like isoform X1 [Ceratitis capitata]
MKQQFVTFFTSLLLAINVCCGEDKDPQVFSTIECQLTEPIYGQKFDFNFLHSDIAKVAKSPKGDTFEYNICGNLSRTCDGKNVAACLRRGDQEFVLGTHHVLNYRHGKMFLEFSNGAKCPNGDGDLKLFVHLGCDYTLDAQQSSVTPYAADACSFYILLETPYACLPEPDAVKSNGCSIQDPVNGHNYDLLSLSDFNYRATDRRGNAFVVNICKPVLYGENVMCPSDSSVCFIQLNSTDYKKRFFNYGTVQPNPTIENGNLIMRLPSPTPCNGTSNYSSTIHFMCDDEKKSSKLSFLGVNECVYEFSFTTPLACNDNPPCTTITHGSEFLDMRSLQGKTYELSMPTKNYTLGICSNAGQPCMANDGACLAENQQTTGLGQMNSQLRYNHSGTPYLLYTDGALCDGQTKWSTKIEFVCANNATKDNGTADNSNGSNGDGSHVLGPKIIENKNCQLLIHFQTPLACQEQIECKVKVFVEHTDDGMAEEEVVDLTPLISATDNYEAEINNASITEQQVPKSTKFFLNICRPLVPKFGLGCPGGSAACMAKVDSTSPTPEEEKSLGFPMASLVAHNRTNAELRYLGGSTCPTDSQSELSSSIELHCDMRAGLGKPILQLITDCHYQFEWATNVICPSHMCTFNEEKCEIINDDINYNYEVKTAPFTNEGKMKISIGKSDFTLDICGKHRKAETDYAEGSVNLYFTTDAPCGKSNVQLRLICSGDTKQVINYNNAGKDCNLVVNQRTPDICKFLKLAVPPSKANNGNNSGKVDPSSTEKAPTTTSAIPSTPDSKVNGSSESGEAHRPVGAILAIIICMTSIAACVALYGFSPDRRNTLRRCFRHSTSAVRYSRVQSGEEANLLLGPSGEFSDSDDDMLL